MNQALASLNLIPQHGVRKLVNRKPVICFRRLKRGKHPTALSSMIAIKNSHVNSHVTIPIIVV